VLDRAGVTRARRTPSIDRAGLTSGRQTHRELHASQLWWLYPIDPTRPTDAGNVVYAASGNLNQWLFVVPHLDLVMVMTGQSNTHFGAPVQILMRDILPAVREN
jgi:CubicO group peptidase (beta-lactamase class C family)